MVWQQGVEDKFVRHLFEVSVYNAKGDCLIDTTVDYGIKIQELDLMGIAV
jgi:hypothetical protein